MKMRLLGMSRLAAILMLGLSAAACQRQQETKPDAAALAGTWTLADESIRSIVTRMGRKPAGARLDLASDGGLTAVDLPVEDPFSKPAYRLVSGKGRWRLEKKQDWMVDVFVERGAGGSYSVETGSDGKSELVYHVYDPDSTERWVWRRAP